MVAMLGWINLFHMANHNAYFLVRDYATDGDYVKFLSYLCRMANRQLCGHRVTPFTSFMDLSRTQKIELEQRFPKFTKVALNIKMDRR